MPSRLAFYSTLLLTVLVLVSLLVAYLDLSPLRSSYQDVILANDSGYVALFLVAGTGVLMVFRKPLLRLTRDPEGLRWVHVILSVLAGLFIVIHVAFLIFYPITLPVLFGYLGVYFAFVIWVTGLTFIEGFRGSLFYHGLLSLIAVALIVIHVFTAGRGLPMFVSGAVLVAIAAVVLIGGLRQLTRLPEGSPRPAGN